MKIKTASAWIALLFLLCSDSAIAQRPVLLASRGLARFPVVTAPGAGEQTRKAAADLADYLGRITGTEFKIEEGDGLRGLAVGTVLDFPELGLENMFRPGEPLRREDYLLRTHRRGIYLVGSTEPAVDHAVWDFLYRIGYRQFFPGETWEIIPQNDAPRIALDVFEQPDFYQRRTGVGHGLLRENTERHRQWCRRNRFVSVLDIVTSHAYGRIIRRNQAAFDEHPEYLALVDGERRGSKFCISNPGLRALVVEDALAWFRENPDADSISIEPSDGGGWCECEPCAEMGSISDRVVILANAVASAVEREFPDKFIGLLAYHLHSPPPSVRVHPRIVVRAATNAVRFGYTHQQIIEGWAAMGAAMGVFDLYSVHMWDQSRPASQKGSDLPTIRKSLTRYYRSNARFISIAHSDNWGPSGLGMYIAARILWDVSEADRIEDLFDDFLENAFGAARGPMEDFFRCIYLFADDDYRPLIREDMLARMYGALAAARARADSPEVSARIDHLVLYTRFAELYYHYLDARGDARQEAFEEMLRHTWRIRETHMVHARPLMVRASRDRNVEDPDPETVRDDYVYTNEDIAEFLEAGIKNHQPAGINFSPVSFSRDLVPASALDVPESEPGGFGDVPLGQQYYYTWLTEPCELELIVTGGYGISYPHLVSNVQIFLYAHHEPTGDPVDFNDSIEPNQEAHKITLKSPYEGLHRVRANPPANRAVIEAPENLHWTMEAGRDEHNRLSGDWTLYFYVPRGTPVVGGFADMARGRIIDADGRSVLDFRETGAPVFFDVPVSREQEGRFWKFEGCRGVRYLMTVPPFLARTPEELLLPREVVEADTVNKRPE